MAQFYDFLSNCLLRVRKHKHRTVKLSEALQNIKENKSINLGKFVLL